MFVSRVSRLNPLFKLSIIATKMHPLTIREVNKSVKISNTSTINFKRLLTTQGDNFSQQKFEENLNREQEQKQHHQEIISYIEI